VLDVSFKAVKMACISETDKIFNEISRESKFSGDDRSIAIEFSLKRQNDKIIDEQ
jgi:hypothetical protein